MRRAATTVLLLIGVGLIVVPVSMSMFGRSSDGARMVTTFRPIMQPANVQTTADYYNNVFTKLRPIALMMNALLVEPPPSRLEATSAPAPSSEG